MRGSVLVFTLLLLSIALVAALSLATAVVVGTKTASDTNKSVQAFQTADSGVEQVLQAIKNSTTDNLSDLGTCDSGKIRGNVRTGDRYDVTLYDGDDNVISCSDGVKKISDVRKIKSVGKFGGAVRAVETAVAAGGSGVTGGCYVTNNTTISDGWGQGCKADGQNVGGNRCEGAADNTHECGFSAINGSDYVCICIEK